MIIPAKTIQTLWVILIQNYYSTLIAIVSIIVTIIAIWIAHIITERYTAHKKYIEWLHDLNQRYYIKMSDYMDNLSKTLKEYRFFLEAFIKDERTEKALIWSFYLICSFVKLFKKLNDEVGDIRLFNFQKAHVDGLTIRKLNYFLIELFKEFMDVKYVEEIVDIYTYTHFEQGLLKSDDALKQSFENFKRWIKDYNNLNSLINLSRLYSDVLLMAVMQTYPLSNPMSLRGFLSWIKSKIFRKDVILEKVIGIDPKTIKKAQNIVKCLEERENLIKNVRLILESLNNDQSYVNTTEKITVFEKKKLKQLRHKNYHVKTKVKHTEVARYELKSKEDLTTALRNTTNLYLKLYNDDDRLKLPFDFRCFWCYGLDHEIYITDTPNNDEIDEWINFVKRWIGENISCVIILNDTLDESTIDKYNKNFKDVKIIFELNFNDKDKLIEIIEFVLDAIKNDKRVVIQSSNGMCGLIISAYLVYVVGMTKEDALELTIRNGLYPFYNDDIKNAINMLKELKIKRISKNFPI